MAGDLIARWTDEPLRRVVAAARRGVSAETSPFGLHDGRGDLRGLDVRTLLGDRIKRVRFEHVDLSDAVMGPGLLQQCEFDDVIFDKADFRSNSDHGNRFTRCFFRKTDFRVAGIGYYGSRYERCVFERADFRRAVFGWGEFDGCRFEHCKLNGADFSASSFSECTFIGVLDDVWFRGGFASKSERRKHKARPNRMEHVDFRDAVLHWLTLSDGVDLSTIVPPADGRHVVIDALHERLERFREFATKAPERLHPAAEHFLTVYSSRPEQDWLILNVDDMVGEYGRVGADFILEGLGFDQRA